MARAGAKFDLSAVQRRAAELARLPGLARDRVVKRSLATLNRRLVPATKAAVLEDFGISATSIGKRLFGKATDVSVTIYGETSRVPLNEFGGRYSGRKSKGATAQISKNAGRKTYSSAFIIKGKKAIYARKIVRGGQGDLSRGARAGRFPLVRLTGPSAVDMVLGNGQVKTSDLPADRVQRIAEEIFTKEVDRLINVELAK